MIEEKNEAGKMCLRVQKKKMIKNDKKWHKDKKGGKQEKNYEKIW